MTSSVRAVCDKCIWRKSVDPVLFILQKISFDMMKETKTNKNRNQNQNQNRNQNQNQKQNRNQNQTQNQNQNQNQNQKPKSKLECFCFFFTLFHNKSSNWVSKFDLKYEVSKE